MCQRDPTAPNPGNSAGLPDELASSYSRAVYRVDAQPSAIYLEVGRGSVELDRWLSAASVSRFAFLSAANPGSRALGDDENQRRHDLLVARLGEGGLPTVPGESYDPVSGGWREASVLIAGIDRAAAIAIAREFGQAALLYGEIGGPVELVPAAGPAEKLRR